MKALSAAALPPMRRIDYRLPSWARKKRTEDGRLLSTCPVCDERGVRHAYKLSDGGRVWWNHAFSTKEKLLAGMRFREIRDEVSCEAPENGANRYDARVLREARDLTAERFWQTDLGRVIAARLAINPALVNPAAIGAVLHPGLTDENVLARALESARGGAV